MSDEQRKQKISEIPAIVIEIGSRARIRGLNLVRANCEVVAALKPGEQIPSINVGSRGGADRHPTDANVLVCSFGADVAALGPGGPVARISFDYAVQYEFPDEAFVAKLKDSEMALFTAYNASIHIWPFARELVFTLSSKMGLPPVMLPLFRPSEILGDPERWKVSDDNSPSDASKQAPQA